jgi:hypothetical protein
MSASLRRRACVAAVAVGLVAAGCSGGGSSKSAPSTTTRPEARVDAVAGMVGVATAGAPAELAAADRDAVVAAVGSYVQDATVAPLEGEKVPDLSDHFAAVSAGALQGAERDALVDTDVPAATGRVTPTLEPVNLRGLADANGTIDLVGATLDVTVRATAAGGPITIHRTGELMFTRDAGTWKILGFRLAVTRDGAGLGAAGATSSTSGAAP